MKISPNSSFIKSALFHPLSLIFSVLVSLIPIILAITHFVHRLEMLHEQKDGLIVLHKKSVIAKRKKALDACLLEQMKGADPSYLEKKVESLSFLAAEQRKWEELSEQTPSIKAIENRLSFLKGDKNHLHFKQDRAQREGQYTETLVSQTHPVEVCEEDIKKILSSIEGIKTLRYLPEDKRPQLIIEKFDLTKTTHPELKEKAFILSMNIIKRELNSETSR